MIPKIIHYCWFGDQQFPQLTEKCIESWQKYLPDYKMVLWDEKRFDIDYNQFTKEAYECKKFAFVSDYVRLFALYYYGGVYLDTDVEVIKNINPFLRFSAFSGFENPLFLQSGVIGAKERHPWIYRFLEYYKDKSFYNKNGTMDLTANVRYMTPISVNEYGLKTGNGYQILKEDVHIFPTEYFCPMIWETREIILTENTHAIHHFAASWM
jgi:mannosyltransferase OCH1-like enzyme